MSQENLEVVRRMYSLLSDRGAWRRREYDQVFLEYCSADYELIPPPAYPDASTSHRSSLATSAENPAEPSVSDPERSRHNPHLRLTFCGSRGSLEVAVRVAELAIRCGAPWHEDVSPLASSPGPVRGPARVNRRGRWLQRLLRSLRSKPGHRLHW